MTVGLYLGLLDILSENKEANKIHIHTCCIKASHSETIPGLCFEIMAEGGSKVVKESPVSKMSFMQALLLPLCIIF